MTFYETASGRLNAIEFSSEKPVSDTLLCIHGFCCDARVFSYVGRKLSSVGYRMMKDPQVNFRCSCRFVVDILARRNSKISELSDFGNNIPLLILHGRKDRMIYLQVSEEFFKLLDTNMKEIKIFDCDHWFYDAIFYDQSFSRHGEQSRMQIISSIADWLKSRNS